VYKIAAELPAAKAQEVLTEFTDPVIQESSLGKHPTPAFDWLLLVGFRPGVTDNVGRTARTAIADSVVIRRTGFRGARLCSTSPAQPCSPQRRTHLRTVCGVVWNARAVGLRPCSAACSTSRYRS